MTDAKAKTGTLNPSSNLTGKKPVISHTFHTKTIILPRQARIKHRETNPKGGGFLTVDTTPFYNAEEDSCMNHADVSSALSF